MHVQLINPQDGMLTGQILNLRPADALELICRGLAVRHSTVNGKSIAAPACHKMVQGGQTHTKRM